MQKTTRSEMSGFYLRNCYAIINYMDEKELVKYFKSLGISVNTRTKARGHQGFFVPAAGDSRAPFRKNRIDVSKNTPPERVIPTLIHEFAHYIHHKIEPDMHRTGGNLSVLFCSDAPVIKEELLKVTNFVDKNSLCARLYERKEAVKSKIKEYEKLVKKDFPDFARSKKFVEFERYIRRSKAKYLLKYDRVKVVSGLFNSRVEIYTLEGIERDFPEMPAAFAACIRLKSAQRRQTRTTARINRLQKYYKRPSELFARLAEGLYLDKPHTCELAPFTTQRFYELLGKGYYLELGNVL